MKNKKKGITGRFLSILLAAVIALSLLPADVLSSAVYAEEADTGICEDNGGIKAKKSASPEEDGSAASPKGDDTEDDDTEEPEAETGSTDEPGDVSNRTDKPETGDNSTDKPETGDNSTDKPEAGDNSTDKPESGDNSTDKPESGDNSTDKPETGNGSVEGSDHEEETEERPASAPKEDTTACICGTLCTTDSANADCSVCGAEGIGIAGCKGEPEEAKNPETEEDTKQEDTEEDMEQEEIKQEDTQDTGLCGHHPEHTQECGYTGGTQDKEGTPCTYACRICPIEDLIVALPEEVTEDNAKDVRAQLDEILALYKELTQDEQDQLDLSRCYALQEALDAAGVPAPAEGVVYGQLIFDGDYGQVSSANGPGYTWDAATSTLTLENFQQEFAGNGATIIVPTGSTVFFKGTNTIKINGTISYVIHGETLTIDCEPGSTLELVSGSLKYGLVYGHVIVIGSGIPADVTLKNVGEITKPYYVLADDKGNVLSSIVPEAKIERENRDDVYVLSLKNAFDSQYDGATVTLLRDVTSEMMYVSNAFRLDLAGHTVQSSGQFLRLENGADVVVSGEGSVNAASNAFDVMGGTLTLESGTFRGYIGAYITGGTLVVPAGAGVLLEGNGDALFNRNAGLYFATGAVHLSGGQYTGSGSAVLSKSDNVYQFLEKGYVYRSGSTTMTQDTTTTTLFGTITVEPCPGHSWDYVTDETVHKGICSFCKEEGATEEHTIENGICTVCGYGDISKAIATVTSNGTVTYYTDLDKAWNAAQGKPSATLTLHQSVDLGASTLTLNSGNVTLEMDENVTLSGKSANSIICVNNGTLTVGSGTIYNKNVASNTSAVVVKVAGGTLNITGGTLRSFSFQVKLLYVDSGSVILSGGTFTGIGGIVCADGRSVSSLLASGYAYKKDGAWCSLGDVESTSLPGSPITVEKAPVQITAQPQDTGTTYEKASTLGIAVQSEGTVTYAWYLDGVAVTGASGSTFTPSGLAVGEHTVHCVVTCDGCPVKSETATVTVGPCTHEGVSVCQSNGNGTHTLACSACGYTGAAEKCGYTFNENAGTCQACGSVLTVSVSGTDGLVYDGNGHKPAVTATVGGTALTENTDYTVSYSGDCKDAGSYTVTVTGTTFDGAYTKAFSIQKADVTGNDLTYMPPADLYYTGAPKAAAVEVKNGINGIGVITVQYKKDDKGEFLTEVSEPGTYQVYAIVAEGTNYNDAEIKMGQFTISYMAAPALLYNGSSVRESYYNGDVAVTALSSGGDACTVSDAIGGGYEAAFTIRAQEGAVEKTLHFKDKDGHISAGVTVRVDFDLTPPTGSVSVGAKWWQNAMHFVSFGHYAAKEYTVAIKAEDKDGSGIGSIDYAIVTGDTQYADVNVLAKAVQDGKVSWTKYENGRKPTVPANSSPYAVYARLTDNAGNITYISTDGILLDSTPPVVEGLSVPKEGIEDVTAGLTFTVSEAADYYFVVLPEDSAAPSAEDIIVTCGGTLPAGSDKTGTSIAGTAYSDSGVVSADTFPASVSVDVKNLSPNTAYAVYVTAVDKALDLEDGTPAGNIGDVAGIKDGLSFRTKKTLPVITKNPAVSGIYGQGAGEMAVTGGTVQGTGGAALTGTWTVSGTDSGKKPAAGTTEEVTVIFTPDSDSYESVSAKVIPTVSPRSLSAPGVTISEVAGDYTYTGSEIKPPVSVNTGTPASGISISDSGADLNINDFTVSYSNNTNAGTASITITGKGNYTGPVTRTFTIKKAPGRPIPDLTGSYTDNGETYTYTITPIEGAVYCMGNSGGWTAPGEMAGNVFEGIKPGTGVAFYAKMPETGNYEEGEAKSITVDFPKLTPAAPVLSYTRETDEETGQITLTIAEVTGAEYSFDGGQTWTDSNRKGGFDTSRTVALAIRLKETDTHNPSAAQTVTVNLAKEDRKAPPAFTLSVEANGETDYTVTIPTTEGCEYSFDGETWSDVNRKTGVKVGETVTGYKRYQETDAYNASAPVSAAETMPRFTVKTPVISPAGGVYEGSVSVTITCGSPDAEIYYTTDGGTPGRSSTRYTGAFTVSAPATVKAIAVKEGFLDSAIASETYTKKAGGSGNSGGSGSGDSGSPGGSGSGDSGSPGGSGSGDSGSSGGSGSGDSGSPGGSGSGSSGSPGGSGSGSSGNSGGSGSGDSGSPGGSGSGSSGSPSGSGSGSSGSSGGSGSSDSGSPGGSGSSNNGNNGSGNYVDGNNGNNGNGGQNLGDGTPLLAIPAISPADNTLNPGQRAGSVKPGAGDTGKPGIGNTAAGSPAMETKQPFIKGRDGKTGWDVIRTEEEQAKEGSIINVDMNGSAVVPGDIFDSIKGKDITVTFDMGNGIVWSVDGKGITADKAGDIDFSVKTGTNAVPVDIVDATGERYGIQISLPYDGEFGFTAVLSINLGKGNAGYTASLYHCNGSTGGLEFICADEVAEDGTVSLAFTYASDYVVAIDGDGGEGSGNATEPAQPPSAGTDESTGDVPESPEAGQAGRLWRAIIAAVLLAAAIGTGTVLAVRKKGKDENSGQ